MRTACSSGMLTGGIAVPGTPLRMMRTRSASLDAVLNWPRPRSTPGISLPSGPWQPWQLLRKARLPSSMSKAVSCWAAAGTDVSASNNVTYAATWSLGPGAWSPFIPAILLRRVTARAAASAAPRASRRRRKRQGIRDQLCAARGRAADAEHHELPAVHGVSHRHARRRAGDRGLPDLLPGGLVVGMEYRLAARALAAEQERLGDEEHRLRPAAGRRDVQAFERRVVLHCGGC